MDTLKKQVVAFSSLFCAKGCRFYQKLPKNAKISDILVSLEKDNFLMAKILIDHAIDFCAQFVCGCAVGDIHDVAVESGLKTLRTNKSKGPIFSFAYLDSVQRDVGILDAFTWNDHKDLLKGSIYEFARIFAKCFSGYREKCVGANDRVLYHWSECYLLASEKENKLDRVPAKHNDLARVRGAHL